MPTKNRLELENTEENPFKLSLPPSKKLGSRPRKEKLVHSFQDKMSLNAPYLILSQISRAQVQEWTLEPWHINNVRKASEWLRNYLQPLIDKVETHLRVMPAESWKILQLTNTNHEHLRTLYRLQNEVKLMWMKRPRFPSDKKRMEKEGL